MLALLLTIVSGGLTSPGSQPEIAPPPRSANPFAKWEKSIFAIEKRFKDSPPAPGRVFFAGSSSIVQWDLKKWFPETTHVNVGFGGSVIADSTHFATSIITPYQPGTIVFYAGDNDIAQGRKPEQVEADFKAFVAVVRKDNPNCRVLFIAVKPSVARWKLYDVQSKANARVKAFCEKERGLIYVDIVAPMLRADGTPDPGLFVKDGLHLSAKGYEIWTAAVNKALK